MTIIRHPLIVAILCQTVTDLQEVSQLRLVSFTDPHVGIQMQELDCGIGQKGAAKLMQLNNWCELRRIRGWELSQMGWS